MTRPLIRKATTAAKEKAPTSPPPIMPKILEEVGDQGVMPSGEGPRNRNVCKTEEVCRIKSFQNEITFNKCQLTRLKYSFRIPFKHCPQTTLSCPCPDHTRIAAKNRLS